MDFQFLILLTAALLNLELVGIVLIHGFKRRSSKYFVLMSLGITIWIISNYLSNYVKDYQSALLWNKLIFIGCALATWSFLIFSKIFPEDSIPEKKYFSASFLLFGAAALISLTPLLIEKITLKENVSDITFGQGIYFYAIFLVGCLIAAVTNMIYKYSKTTDLSTKKTLRLLISGMAIFLILSIITNLLLPIFLKNFSLTNFAPFYTVIFISIFAFAILKYGFLNIKVIISEMLVAVMGTALFIFPFLMPTDTLAALAFGFFLLFLVIGYLLIKYTYKEINAKNLLEGLVQDRTKELEQSKKTAEERAAELERWYKLTIGREVRMAELKDKIKEMENKIKK